MLPRQTVLPIWCKTTSFSRQNSSSFLNRNHGTKWSLDRIRKYHKGVDVTNMVDSYISRISKTAPEDIQISGLSGNEIYCLDQKYLKPGDYVLGNCVVARTLRDNFSKAWNSLNYGEIPEVTKWLNETRHSAIERLEREAIERGAFGITGVTCDVVHHQRNMEFLVTGSCVYSARSEIPPRFVHNANVSSSSSPLNFTSSSDGQELFCVLDAGFTPVRFVCSSAAYSPGLLAGMSTLTKGESGPLSAFLNDLRYQCLRNLENQAVNMKVPTILNIETQALWYDGVAEMFMIGTAATHPTLQPPRGVNDVITCDTTSEEMWSLANCGYAPVKLVMGVSVYSIGIMDELKSWFQSISNAGQLRQLSELVYEARKGVLRRVREQAVQAGADKVVGLKTHIFELSPGVIEFIAIGTAVKKQSWIKTESTQLPPQAVIRDRNTFSASVGAFLENSNEDRL